MTEKDYYAVLGIKRTADDKEIKRAFRTLAKKYHPDTNQGDGAAEQRFKEINEAYDILGDPKKRKLYDQYGTAAFQEGFDPQAYEEWKKWQGSQSAGAASFHDMGDMGDLFSQLFRGAKRGGADPFSSGDSFHSWQGFSGFHEKMRGSDLTSDITISFEEAAFGCDRTFSLSDPSGRQVSLQVHIPAGIEEGKKVRLKEKGAPGMNGGKAGDLLLTVHIAKKAGWERKGCDVYVTASIPFTTAALGGEAIVETLHGNVSCRIPAGTQSGSKIRLRGKGTVSMRNPGHTGDEYVVVQIQVPRSLTEQQKKKLQEFADLSRPGTGEGRRSPHAA